MIGLCYYTKNDFGNAIKTLESGLGEVADGSEEKLSFMFDMAEALIKSGDGARALEIFKDIKAQRPSFRNVSRRISELEAELAKVKGKSEDVDLPESRKKDDDEDDGSEDEDDGKKDKISYI